MKVFVVHEEENEEIVTIFSSKEKAQEFVKLSAIELDKVKERYVV